MWQRPWPVAFLVDERELIEAATAMSGERSSYGEGRRRHAGQRANQGEHFDWIHDR
jgi:hypothetical protein